MGLGAVFLNFQCWVFYPPKQEPSPPLPLPAEVVSWILNYTLLCDFPSLSLTSKNIKAIVDTELIRRAKEYGLAKKDCTADEARAYLSTLLKVIRTLHERGLLPKRITPSQNTTSYFTFFRQTHVNFEQLFLQLPTLSVGEIAQMYSSRTFHEIPGIEIIHYWLQNARSSNRAPEVLDEVASTQQQVHLNRALQLSCLFRVRGMAHQLLTYGARTDVQSEGEKDTVLFSAVKRKDLKTVQLLLNRDANPNTPDENGSLPFHWAAQMGYDDIVKEFLNRGTPINSRGHNGTTALLFAVGTMRKVVIKMLLGRGADPNIPDNNQCFPLHSAAQGDDSEIVERLLDRGAHINARDSNGKTALKLAVEMKKYTVIKCLLGRGADPNIPDNHRWFPLHAAFQNSEITEWLLDHGAEIDAQGNTGQTPLHFAVRQKEHAVIRILLNRGANPNAPDNTGLRPLHIVVLEKYRNPDVIEWLLDNGAEIDAQNNNGNTPLLLAVGKGNTTLVETLLSHGANLSLSNSKKEAPLPLAKRRQDRDMIATLLLHPRFEQGGGL